MGQPVELGLKILFCRSTWEAVKYCKTERNKREVINDPHGQFRSPTSRTLFSHENLSCLVRFWKVRADDGNKTCVINYPLGQILNPASKDHFIHLNLVLSCEISESVDGQCENSGHYRPFPILTTIGLDLGLAEWIKKTWYYQRPLQGRVTCSRSSAGIFFGYSPTFLWKKQPELQQKFFFYFSAFSQRGWC